MGAITLRKEKQVLEDMEVGTGTVQQKRGEMTKINGGNIPYDDTKSINEAINEKESSGTVDTKIATREIKGGDATTVFKALDGVNDEDVATIKQLTAFIIATYTKTEINAMLADKADKTNTMLMDGTTPNPDYSLATRGVPANKGYVLDTVQNIGAGDMAKADYDRNASGTVDTTEGVGIATGTMGVTPYTQFLRLGQGTITDFNTIDDFGIFIGKDIPNAPTSGLVGVEQMDLRQSTLDSVGIMADPELQVVGGKAQRALSFSTFKWYFRAYDAGSDTWGAWSWAADETDVRDLETAIATETTRATGAEQANASAISAETTRATGAEQANATAIATKAEITYVDSRIVKLTQAEYDGLTPDATVLYVIVG